MSNSIGYIITNEAITVTLDGISHIIPKSALNYAMVKKAIKDNDANTIKEAIESKGFIGAITEGNVQYDNGVLKYKNHEIAPSIADKLTTILNEGISAAPWLKFVDRLLANPSKRCLDNLYEFLDHKGMPISQTGTCLGYKGVNEDYYSHHGNPRTIILQGSKNDDHQIYNGVGEIIEVDRISVDDDPNNGCSEGLHIGSFDYADSWAGSEGRLMLVEFDPRNCVSVPSDCEYQKLRVTKYEVINEITENRKLLDRPVYNLDDKSEDGYSNLHPVSQEEVEKAIQIINQYTKASHSPVTIKELSKLYDVSMYDLINKLIDEGYTIDWANPSNPTANKYWDN